MSSSSTATAANTVATFREQIAAFCRQPIAGDEKSLVAHVAAVESLLVSGKSLAGKGERLTHHADAIQEAGAECARGGVAR